MTQALTTRFGNSGADYADAEAGWLVEAAPLTKGSAAGKGVSAPGRRKEDDENLVSATFVKRHGANTADDHEIWDEDVTARTLNGMGQAGANGALVADTAVRRLTPTECERLQALPDGWTYPEGESLRDVRFDPHTPPERVVEDRPPDSPRYAACGDAVTASVAEWIADRIKRVRAA